MSMVVELEGRPLRRDEERRIAAQTSAAPSRAVAARRPQSILHPTRVQEFIALFVLGMLGGIAVVFIALFML
jgi:hypothetical protein